MAQVGELPRFDPGEERHAQTIESQGGRVRTGLSVAPHEGRLCILMPLSELVEEYLELVAAAGDAAARLGLPVHIEGYRPPLDSPFPGRPDLLKSLILHWQRELPVLRAFIGRRLKRRAWTRGVTTDFTNWRLR